MTRSTMKLLRGLSDGGATRMSPVASFFLTASALSLCAFVQAQETPQFDQFSAAARCPFPCEADRGTWALYQDIRQLDPCNRTVLLDLNLGNKVDDPTPYLAFRSCSVQGSPPAAALRRRQSFSYDSPTNSTKTEFDAQERTTDIQILRRAGDGAGSAVSAAAVALANHVRADENGGPTILFAMSESVIVGVFAGRQTEKQSLGNIVNEFAKKVAGGSLKQAAAQVCDKDLLSTQIIGIFVDTSGDLAAVQGALRGWHDAECITDSWDQTEVWQDVKVDMVPGQEITIGPEASDEGSLTKRATCSYTEVVAGDGCWAIADRCKITQDQLLEYNPKPNFCNTIIPGQKVCCSAGDLPDFTPQPNPDGSCRTHTIKSGDDCDTIARQNDMTVDQIEDRNGNTWGWTGCSYLIVGGVLCLSTGSPPMPASIANAVCGPQKPGTEKPADMDDLASLNPCPLKACCNVWGQCGITEEFCIESPADTGAPGTATPGSNGCIYNCGMDIVNNGEGPASFMRVGYFEAWNLDRPCLHMLVSAPSRLSCETLS